MTSARKHGGWGAGVAAAAVVLAALASGCNGSGDDARSGSAGASSESLDASALDRVAPERQGLTGEKAPGRAVGSPATGRAGRPAVQTRAVIRKGEIWLVTEEMNRVRTEIDDLLGRLGGYVASEDSRNDRAGRPERAVLVLRVPEPAFADALEDLRRMARTEHVDRSSDDVTTQVIDVDTRVATQEASLARLRTFLNRATTVEDMIRVESEIAARQAELESLKAQQKYLHDQTAMSTVTVHLRSPKAPSPARGDDTGFLAGLEDGWHALTVMLVGAATVLGVLLPFAMALALLGVPVWLVARSVSRRRHAAAAPPPAEAG